MTFQGKVVLVTGASRGIGRAIAIAFAAQEASVVVHYRKAKDSAKSTLEAMRAGNHKAVAADVGDPEQARILVDETVRSLGRIDVLVNNAGIFEHHPPHDTDFDTWVGAWNKTITTNLMGPAHLCYCAVQHMLKQNSGCIVNISSRGAFRGEPDAPAYGASKAGLNAMSQSMAKSLAPRGIHVHTIAPGWVETDMAEPYLHGPEGGAIRAQSPLHRAAKPEEIARTVLFLADPASEYLTGGIVDINGASYLRS